MLIKLRHRGYDSWGIATAPTYSNTISIERSTDGDGLTNATNVIDPINAFQIGHTRYTTQGSHECLDQAQPFVTSTQNIALVHNGQIECDPSRYGSDTERLLEVIEAEFLGSPLPTIESLSQIFRRIHRQLDGSYACIALIPLIGMIAFRDPRGIRPLVVGVDETTGDVSFASESCALPGENIRFIDVLPGQFCWVDINGVMHFSRPMRLDSELCLFEYIYLAHDDSVIDGVSVRQAREMLGRQLISLLPKGLIDVLIPIPHTPVLAGKEICRQTGLEFCELLQVVPRGTTGSGTDRRESRTFILPTPAARETAVRLKFSVKQELIARCRGRVILLLDDSIVRGTTLKHVVQLLRDEVRPSKIFVASLAPPIISPNRYGIDIPNTDNLIAFDPDITEHTQISELVGRKLGLDGPVFYQTRRGITRAFSGRTFEDSVFRRHGRTDRTDYRCLSDNPRELLGYQF
jgi:amidophosphoribosyltransferase